MPGDESEILELGVGDCGFGLGRRRWRGAERAEPQAEPESHDSGARIHIDRNLLFDFENGIHCTVPTNESSARFCSHGFASRASAIQQQKSLTTGPKNRSCQVRQEVF